jgi:hypothetical protein
MNKGGRLNAKVTAASKTDFTIQVQEAKGHEDHLREITLPMEAWNGPGAEVGAELEYPEPERGPKLNDSVLYNSENFGDDEKTPLHRKTAEQKKADKKGNGAEEANRRISE